MLGNFLNLDLSQAGNSNTTTETDISNCIVLFDALSSMILQFMHVVLLCVLSCYACRLGRSMAISCRSWRSFDPDDFVLRPTVGTLELYRWWNSLSHR